MGRYRSGVARVMGVVMAAGGALRTSKVKLSFSRRARSQLRALLRSVRRTAESRTEEGPTGI